LESPKQILGEIWRKETALRGSTGHWRNTCIGITRRFSLTGLNTKRVPLQWATVILPLL